MKAPSYHLQTSEPMFMDKANNLRKIISDYNEKQVAIHLKVSDKLSQSIVQHLKDTATYPALFYYTGTVFKQLNKDICMKHLNYLNQHLYILDAMYGCLRYNDAISFYRLDYLCQIEDINLYDYWQEDLKDLFMQEDLIINLASNEFSRQIHHGNMLTIDFCILEKDKIKRPSMLIKKARGMMLNEMITHQVTDLDQLKEVTFDGYQYDSTRSTINKYVFIKTS